MCSDERGNSLLSWPSCYSFYYNSGYEGRYCDIDIDGCASELTACFEGVDCVDNPAPSEGASCGPCPQGYSGNGTECKGEVLPLYDMQSLTFECISVLVSTMASPETTTNSLVTMASPETTTNGMETFTLLQWQNAVIVTLPGLTTRMVGLCTTKTTILHVH